MSSALLNVATAEDMRALGRTLGEALHDIRGDALLIGLEGDLGSGKTTLVGGVLAGLGVAGPIRSPTYTLIEPYADAGRPLYHLDLYRLRNAREVEALALEELLTPNAVLLIEWPSRGAGRLPSEDLSLALEYAGGQAQGRVLRARAQSPAGHTLLEAFSASRR